jgi:hypothetical protein
MTKSIKRLLHGCCDPEHQRHFLETRNLFVVRITGSLQNSACASTWSEATPLNVYLYTLWNGLKPVPAKSVEATPLRPKAGLRSDVDSIKRLPMVGVILSSSPAPMFSKSFMFSNGTCSIRKIGSEDPGDAG